MTERARPRHRHPRTYAVRFMGWQLDYRPDGWLPPSIRRGSRRWWVLRLGGTRMVTFGRVKKPAPPRPVTVTLTADVSQVVRALERTHHALEDLRWTNRLRAERTAARRWWGDQAEAMWATYGWEWPGPPPGSPWGPR